MFLSLAGKKAMETKTKLRYVKRPNIKSDEDKSCPF